MLIHRNWGVEIKLNSSFFDMVFLNLTVEFGYVGHEEKSQHNRETRDGMNEENKVIKGWVIKLAPALILLIFHLVLWINPT